MDEDPLLANVNEAVERLELTPAVFVERQPDGLIEVCGLGCPVYGSDDQLGEAFIALLELDATLDPDDLRDRVAKVFLTALDG